MTPVEVVFVSVLLFSLALNGILGAAAIRLLRDLRDVQSKLWHLAHLALGEDAPDFPLRIRGSGQTAMYRDPHERLSD